MDGLDGRGAGQVAPLDAAMRQIAAASDADGRREDVVIEDVRKLYYGAAPEGVCALASVEPARLFPLRKTAFAQIATHIGATSRFLLRMPRGLQTQVLNWGLRNIANANARGVLRLANGEARALVSARYAVLDHPAAWQAVTDALVAAGLSERAEVVSTATGLTLLVRVLWTESDETTTQDGSRLTIGLDLTNGEVGNRALALHPVVYHRRLAAATRRSTWRRRHFGVGTADGSLHEDLVAAIPECIADARRIRDLVLRSAQKSVDDAVAEAEVLRTYGLSVAEAREAVRRLMAERAIDLPEDTAAWPEKLAEVEALTVYDVWCAIVASAKGAPGTDRRLDIEDAATRYLAARLK